MYRGSCLCGKITYAVVRFGPLMAHCHCTDCRKFHGAAFSTFGEAKCSEFEWLTGKDILKTFIAPNGSTRQFCSHCGSSLTFQPANHRDIMEISVASLDGEHSLSPDAHVFCRSKVSWITLEDGLPKFASSRGNQ
ncbi:GFA family protein [Aliiglaciecola sp. M165]|uniref:GFA family protein n=1 Tax=Aliiglaciecola sp. M165 TaxID=2593649 RepID=UPI00117D019E|nr:GFA family protein [Aliiglaciecola sp. M165]TRY33236.1 GFA family protein [Aliiglaciecola sp. M165]